MNDASKRSRKYDLLIVAGLLFVAGALCATVGAVKLHRADALWEAAGLQTTQADETEFFQLMTMGRGYLGIGVVFVVAASIIAIAGPIVRPHAGDKEGRAGEQHK